jgi:hypothetical protein
MGVLDDGDPLHLVAIVAGVDGLMREASGSTLLRAALVDATNAGDVVKLGIPGPVELLITHWRRSRITAADFRSLIVDVKVLSASHLTGTINTTTVASHDIGSICIALVLTVTKEVLGSAVSGSVVVNGNASRALVDAFHVWPHTIVVNLWADGCAVLVVCLAGIVDAGLRSTLGQKLLLGVIVEEDIDVAFDLLGGRPVNLAVLLQALLLVHVNLILTPALLLALLKVDRAGGELTCILLAEAFLEFLLGPVAIHVNSEEGMVISLALIVQLDPLSISRLVSDDLA